MPPDFSGMTVREILKRKKGQIKQARLVPGSPSWDALQSMTWEQVLDSAKRNIVGYKTILKLLSSTEYDK